MMDGKKALAAAQEAIGKVSEAKVENAVIAPVEGDTASQAYDIGDYLMHDGKFCKVISAIAQGDPIIMSGAGTNVTERAVSSELGSGGGGGGTSDYDDLSNKPSINNTTLSGSMSAADLGLVAAENGKGLSSNDYTDEDKTKLASLHNYDDTVLSGRVTTIEGMIPSDASSSNKLATAADIPSTSGFALKSEMSVVDGEGGNADKTTITLKTGTAATVLNSHQDISGKADKSEMSVTDGSGADADKTTIQLKSGTSATVLKSHQSITGKADKVQSATNGDFAGLDANGNLTDSGKKASDFTGKSFDGTMSQWSALSSAEKAEYTGLVTIKDDTANAMLVDSVPTANSNNLVKSGGVYTAVDGCVHKTGTERITGVKTFESQVTVVDSSDQESVRITPSAITAHDDLNINATEINFNADTNVDGDLEINGDVIIGQHYDSTQSQNVGSNLTVSGVVTVNGSDYAERFETIEDCPEGRFVTLDGEKIRLAQPDDDYILGVTSENPAIIGDKDNPGTPVGLIGKLWVESDGTCKVNGFAVSGANGIATDGGSTGYRVMAVDGNRVKVLVK